MNLEPVDELQGDPILKNRFGNSIEGKPTLITYSQESSCP